MSALRPICLCGERMASLPRPVETAECSRARFADQLEDFVLYMASETGTVAKLYPVKLLENIEVSDEVRRATSIPGQSEPQSCG